MNWFKHLTGLGNDYRVLNMMDELGFSGYGMYNLMLELIYAQRQKRVKRQTLYTLCRGRFYRSKMDRLIDGYGLFRMDEEGWVTPVNLDAVDDTTTTAGRQQLRTDDALDTQTPRRSNARAYIETEKIEKREEEEDVYDVEEVAAAVVVDEGEGTEEKGGPACPDEPDGAGEEQSEARRELAARFGTLPCYRHLVALCDRHTPWAEMVAMQSGYGGLLMEYWEEALLLFACHALSMDAVSRLATLQDVRSYFMNYARASGPTGRHLREHLEQLHARRQEQHIRDDPYRYEQREGDVRMVDGRPIPPDAPPRPDPRAYWNDWEGVWQTVF